MLLHLSSVSDIMRLRGGISKVPKPSITGQHVDQDDIKRSKNNSACSEFQKCPDRLLQVYFNFFLCS